MASLRQRLFAFLLSHATGGYLEATRQLRSSLLRAVNGTVLEIGPGTGVNFAFLPSGIQWIGVEPNPFLNRKLATTLTQAGFNHEPALLSGSGECLPMKDSSVDFVVSTLVLCSVASQAAVLGEIRRVLKPGGQFLFLEHVAAERGTRLRKIQKLATPIVQCIGDGCRLDCETAEKILEAGFSKTQIERRILPIPFHGPHIVGSAKR